uniref:Cytochrome b5 heme-binding domain-containing protein n=1 Tax=Compsopogon caeruleus TaxID=31354 RepID=A0A6T6CYR5_9RHOD|mmetsp:Transcript_6568/g.13249  ORF Transcript_6568/g.13249 Transcript_6568/m.13249 type:complete len:361 (+) Transcript_6568:462-1544(+)
MFRLRFLRSFARSSLQTISRPQWSYLSSSGSSSSRVKNGVLLTAALGGAVLTADFLWDQSSRTESWSSCEDRLRPRSQVVQCDAEARTSAHSVGQPRPGLKEFGDEEIARHRSKETRIWVTYKHGVYDITDFVDMHPGGAERIMMAAGSSIEPFWEMYSQHAEGFVYDLLEEYRIGNRNPKDVERASFRRKNTGGGGPYENEPERHPALLVRSAKPFNAEPPLELLGENPITPNELFYVRNHLPVPVVDPDSFRLEVCIEGRNCVQLSLEDLRTKFEKHSVTATIQCAGNRRNEMTELRPVKGGFWDVGAISTAEWSGARMSEVMKFAGLSESNVGNLKHLQFEGWRSPLQRFAEFHSLT